MEPVGDIKVIPQVFYDVIARIIPGAVGIWALMSASNRKAGEVIEALFHDATELKTSTFVFILTFLVLAYLLGHFISALSDFLFFKWIFTKLLRSFSKAFEVTRGELCTPRLEERVNWLIDETVGRAEKIEDVSVQKPQVAVEAEKEAQTKEKSEDVSVQKPQSHHNPIRTERELAACYLWYDRLRVLNPEVGSRLAKLRAEYHMRERIAQVLLIALLLHIVLCLLTWKLPGLAVAWNWYLVIFCIGGFFIARRAAIRACTTFQRSIINHYIVLENLFISDDKTICPALWVKLEALGQDPSFFASNPDEKRKGRKILVTELHAAEEEEATEIEWKPPKQSGKCPVQIMKDTEMAVFTDRTLQDRHYHKKGTEVYTVLNGEMTIEIEEENYHLSSGDSIVVNPGTRHQVKPGGKEFICQVISINCAGGSDKYLQ